MASSAEGLARVPPTLITEQTPPASALEMGPWELTRQLIRAVRRDREEVLLPLLRRMAFWADALDEGRDIPAPAVREGHRLLRSYHVHLHIPRVRQLAQICRTDVPREVWDMDSLIAAEPARVRRRFLSTGSFLSDYERALPGSAQRLAMDLRSLVRAELAWEITTEDLASRFETSPHWINPEATTKVGAGLAFANELRTIERTRVENYLEITSNVAKNAPTRPAASPRSDGVKHAAVGRQDLTSSPAEPS